MHEMIDYSENEERDLIGKVTDISRKVMQTKDSQKTFRAIFNDQPKLDLYAEPVIASEEQKQQLFSNVKLESQNRLQGSFTFNREFDPDEYLPPAMTFAEF